MLCASGLCRVCTGEAKVAYTPSDAPGASPARNRMLTIASLFICMIPTRDIFYESVTNQSRDL